MNSAQGGLACSCHPAKKCSTCMGCDVNVKMPECTVDNGPKTMNALLGATVFACSRNDALGQTGNRFAHLVFIRGHFFYHLGSDLEDNAPNQHEKPTL